MTRYITDEQIDEALREIDSIAREFDRQQYGLPSGDIDNGKPRAKMRDAIRTVLALAAPEPAVPSIDYMALIDAALVRHKYAQGTRACVAFKHGAEWFREQALTAAPAQPAVPEDVERVNQQMLEALEDALHALPTWHRTKVNAAIDAARAAEKGGAVKPETYKQAEGSKNCMQCAAAYMLGIPLSDVPDFEKAGSEAWEAFYAFFADRGFSAEMFPPTVEIDGDYLASGQTKRGTSHMVVMRGGKLLHDPHPSNAGLTSVDVVWVIARKADGPQRQIYIASAPAVPMTEIDFQDDDALRFAQRVLESDAPVSDRKAARDMLVAIRTRVRKAHAAKKGGA